MKKHKFKSKKFYDIGPWFCSEILDLSEKTWQRLTLYFAYILKALQRNDSG
jgi:hypothetical protein